MNLIYRPPQNIEKLYEKYYSEWLVNLRQQTTKDSMFCRFKKYFTRNIRNEFSNLVRNTDRLESRLVNLGREVEILRNITPKKKFACINKSLYWSCSDKGAIEAMENHREKLKKQGYEFASVLNDQSELWVEGKDGIREDKQPVEA